MVERNNYLTPQQETAAYAPCSVVITAGAGTGKTHMLAERYLYYLEQRNYSPLEIVAVTFTEKAAAELRSRIRALVSDHLPQRLDLLAELEAAQISTIHALAARICYEHFQILNLPADFQILEDLEGAIWLNESLRKAIAQLSPDIWQSIPYSLLKEILQQLLADPYTARLALAQDGKDWRKLIFKARIEVIKALIDDPIWQSTWLTLQQHQGKAGDKLEVIRNSVIEAMEDLESGLNIDQAIAIICQVKLNVGSAKNWQNDGLKIVRSALASLRDRLKEVVGKGLLNGELTTVDQELQSLLPMIRKAYQSVSTYLSRLKLQKKVLTFSDLEIYALQAINQPSVQKYYKKRWQIFLVDEFQDTNATQGEILSVLTTAAELTIVGDIKQAIYGFRRADIEVFGQFRDRILSNGGKEVILSTSFRTHQALINLLNQIFAPLLGENKQDLAAARSEIADGNYLEVITVGEGLGDDEQSTSDKPNRDEAQRTEAFYLAQKIQQLLDNKTPVLDKQTKQLRPVQPKDIAILTHTWQPLTVYGDALAARGIPFIPGGGGNLLETREAKDGVALLRFLANPLDDLALVAVLRSPFFTISDRLLYEFRLGFTQDQSDICWWDILVNTQLSEFEHPVNVLKQLLKYSQAETPSRLLQIGDRLTGYTAVIANLAGAERRMADWQGFQGLVKDLQQETHDLFGVVRRLKGLVEQQVAIPRPLLGNNNGVALMTIYAAKGLEWCVVIVADLSKKRATSNSKVLFDAKLGMAIEIKHPTTGETLKPFLYNWLKYEQERKEQAEAIRILYVALTRARDYLILSAGQADKGELTYLQRGLMAANIEPITIPYSATKAIFPHPPTPIKTENLPPLLINSIGSGLWELPVTALTDYARCPQRFKLRYIEGHPGLGSGLAYGMQLGILVHKALEYNITKAQDLIPFIEGEWEQEMITQALALARKFFQLPIYQHFRQTAVAKEQQINLKINQITFKGVIDLVGDDWVLDYKSDRSLQPEDHRFQLWVYAQAMEYPQAYIAYLRHDYLHEFNSQDLKAIAPEVDFTAQQIYLGNYIATPQIQKCAVCPYIAFCDDAMI
ncbi:putative helicase [Chondrocystis sp. NIES-4102]|nr:putative helicase [Chondrocystis sp. NIES-4102]